jgi:hypothetical protein
MSPSPNTWYTDDDRDDHRIVHHWFDADGREAMVWRQDGRWKMHLTLDADSEALHIDLGKTRSVDKALARANHTIGVAQDFGDMQNVVNLASEIEDRTPAEQASLDRLRRSLDRPSFDRDLGRDEGNGYEL